MRTPITYYGGKQKMAKKIVSMIPAHKIYCEPFFGGGAVFFEKKPSKVEVINDTNDQLITFYRALHEDPDAVINAIKNTPHSESLHKLAREIYNKRTDYDKVAMAWAVWWMTNGSFTGSPHGSWKWCNGSAGSNTAIVLARKRNSLSKAVYDRIKFAQISCRDAARCINDRNTEDAFFYLDPPYPGANQKHYGGYSFKDLSKLLELLGQIKGKFILSNYWSQTLRYHVIKNGWHTESITSKMVISNMKRQDIVKEKTEWLIMNFVPVIENSEQQKLYK